MSNSRSVLPERQSKGAYSARFDFTAFRSARPEEHLERQSKGAETWIARFDFTVFRSAP